jgi:thiamine-phosphate pyrophosphorylase
MSEIPTAVLRTIDANLNRLREGLRVLEDIRRYGFDDATTAGAIKALRHQVRIDDYESLLKARDSENDVLRPSTKSEQNRIDLSHIVIANIKRAQESARVLEELLKLHSKAQSEKFKQIRYSLYTIEKDLL